MECVVCGGAAISERPEHLTEPFAHADRLDQWPRFELGSGWPNAANRLRLQ
jgi:hypothetical protein